MVNNGQIIEAKDERTDQSSLSLSRDATSLNSFHDDRTKESMEHISLM